MKVLLIGTGAREHALAWKFSKSKHLGKLYLWPGNPGMQGCGELLSAPASASYEEVLKSARTEGVELVVIGPEAPLSAGMSDMAVDMGFKVFGPSMAAAQLEASKAFAKSVMQAAKVPTAGYDVVDNEKDCAAKAKARLDRGNVDRPCRMSGAAPRNPYTSLEAEVVSGTAHRRITPVRANSMRVVMASASSSSV